MIKQLMKLVAIGVFAVCLTRAPKAEATAYSIVRLDNWLNPSKDPVAATGNPITVWILVDGSWHGLTQTMTGISSAWDFRIPGDPYHVSMIEVDTGGSDMYVLDQVELYDVPGFKIVTIGADNENGWCLSTDPSDGTNSHCNGVAQSFWQFSTGRP